MLFQFKSIQTKLAIIIGCFVLFMFSIVIYTLNIVQSKTNDAAIIGIAGRQQMLVVQLENKTQKLIELLESESSNIQTRHALGEIVVEFNLNLQALKKGGYTLNAQGQTIRLPARNGIIKTELEQVWQHWLTIREELFVLQNPDVDAISDDFYEAISYLEENWQSLYLATQKIGILLQQHSEQKITDLKLFLLIAILITFLVAAFALGFGKQHIVKPILRLNRATQALAQGDLHYEIQIEGRDEISQLAQSFQKMEVQLRAMFSELEAKVAERTQAIQHKNQQLTRLNQEKNEFLAIAAHDLKNPLSAIKGLAEELSEAYDEMSKAEVLESVEMIQNSARQMFALIVNLLDINAIESGKMRIELQQVNILPTVSALVEDYRNRAKAKRISLHFEYAQDEYPALTDLNTLYQVLDNLLSNALKYSPSGKPIYICLQRQDEHVHCEVIDKGPGLSEADKHKLFSKFTRLTPKPTAGEHSTGLGLFIVKKLVEAMRGQVWCESEVGKGSTFVVVLPIPQ